MYYTTSHTTIVIYRSVEHHNTARNNCSRTGVQHTYKARNTTPRRIPRRVPQRELRDLDQGNIITGARTRHGKPAPAPASAPAPATPATGLPGSFPNSTLGATTVHSTVQPRRERTPEQQAIRSPTTAPPHRTPPQFTRSSSLNTSSSDTSAARLAQEIRGAFPDLHRHSPSTPPRHTFEQVDRESDLSTRDFTPTLRLRELLINIAERPAPYSNNQYRRDVALLILYREAAVEPEQDMLSPLITDEIYGMAKGVHSMSSVATRETNLQTARQRMQQDPVMRDETIAQTLIATFQQGPNIEEAVRERTRPPASADKEIQRT